MSEPDVKKHLEEIHGKFVIITSDKASNKFVFICRKYYISKLLADVSPNKNKNSTYSQTQESKDRIIKTNIKYCKKFGLKIIEQDKTLLIMYWLPKMHKTSIDARFIVASKSCSTKPLR